MVLLLLLGTLLPPTFGATSDLILGKKPPPDLCRALLEAAGAGSEDKSAPMLALIDYLKDAGEPRGEIFASQLAFLRTLKQFRGLGPLSFSDASIVPTDIPPEILSTWFPYANTASHMRDWFPRRINTTLAFFLSHWKHIRKRLPYFEFARFLDIDRPELCGFEEDAVDRLSNVTYQVTREWLLNIEEGDIGNPIDMESRAPALLYPERERVSWSIYPAFVEDVPGARRLHVSLVDTNNHAPLPNMAFEVSFGRNQRALYLTDSEGNIALPTNVVSTFKKLRLVGF